MRVASVRGAVHLPLVGVGGILTADHARDYLNAGASLVQMGTASFASPRQPEKVARALSRRGWPRVELPTPAPAAEEATPENPAVEVRS